MANHVFVDTTDFSGTGRIVLFYQLGKLRKTAGMGLQIVLRFQTLLEDHVGEAV